MSETREAGLHRPGSQTVAPHDTLDLSSDVVRDVHGRAIFETVEDADDYRDVVIERLRTISIVPVGHRRLGLRVDRLFAVRRASTTRTIAVSPSGHWPNCLVEDGRTLGDPVDDDAIRLYLETARLS